MYWPWAKHLILFIPFLLAKVIFLFLILSYLFFLFSSIINFFFFSLFYSNSFHNTKCLLLSSSSLSFYHNGHSSALFLPLSILCIKMLVLSCLVLSSPPPLLSCPVLSSLPLRSLPTHRCPFPPSSPPLISLQRYHFLSTGLIYSLVVSLLSLFLS